MSRTTDLTRERHPDEETDTLDGDGMTHDGETRRAPRGRARNAGALGIGILFGLAVGAAVALLFAPRSGDETRARIGHRAHQVRGRVADRWEELQDDIRRSARRGRRKLGRTIANRT